MAYIANYNYSRPCSCPSSYIASYDLSYMVKCSYHTNTAIAIYHTIVMVGYKLVK